jgi:hypothetical protein
VADDQLLDRRREKLADLLRDPDFQPNPEVDEWTESQGPFTPTTAIMVMKCVDMSDGSEYQMCVSTPGASWFEKLGLITSAQHDLLE